MALTSRTASRAKRAGKLGRVIVMQQREVVNKFDRVQPPGTLFTITLLHTDNTEQQKPCFLSATQTSI